MTRKDMSHPPAADSRSPGTDPQGAQIRGSVGVLPLVVRQRLWDQLWQRLLAPVHAADRRDPDGEGR